MKRVCYLIVLVFLASGLALAEENAQRQFPGSSSNTIHSKKTDSDKSDARKKEKSDSEDEVRKRAEQYLKYSGPGFGVKKGYVGGSITVVVPSYRYHHRVCPPQPIYLEPYFSLSPPPNQQLRQAVEATRLFNELSSIMPRPASYAPDVIHVSRAPETAREIERVKRPTPPVMKSAAGIIAGIVSSTTTPGIVVQETDGEMRQYTLTKDTIVLRGAVGEPATEVSPAKLSMGDQVTLRVEDGTVVLIKAQYRTVTGKVVAVASGTVLLDNGKTFKITPMTEIQLPDKAEGKLEDITPGRQAKVRFNPAGDDALSVELTDE
ncbi:MAG: hypothetical protein A2Z18_09330 [Armatimonadetes bacterium RBG_16_58_9]|nr:MAG: hypothetical protein A2Z18_09330 [Armatimonadetes bacterium RBG_16_58_9]